MTAKAWECWWACNDCTEGGHVKDRHHERAKDEATRAADHAAAAGHTVAYRCSEIGTWGDRP